MTKLTDLPNIGPVLAEHLQKSGVETPEQLLELGAEQAFLGIRLKVDAGACLHELEALAGAVAGVRKNQLSPARKAELKTWFRALSAAEPAATH